MVAQQDRMAKGERDECPRPLLRAHEDPPEKSVGVLQAKRPAVRARHREWIREGQRRCDPLEPTAVPEQREQRRLSPALQEVRRQAASRTVPEGSPRIFYQVS